MKAKLGIKENVNYAVLDKDGNRKKVFQPWRWIDAFIKKGFISPLHPKISPWFGYWSSQLKVANLITNEGMSRVAIMLTEVDATGTPFTYIAVGTGATAANATDVALQTEITDSGLQRAAATTSQVTTDVTGDTAQLLKSFSVTGTKAVTESGVFSDPQASGGTMLARQVFSAINVVSGDTLEITWKIDVD